MLGVLSREMLALTLLINLTAERTKYFSLNES
jgi:hypothetical protein